MNGYYIHRKFRYGVIGNPIDAVRADYPCEFLNASDFEEVTKDEYDNTVLDLRFEDGFWQQ